MLALDRQRQIHRQLQAFEDGGQDRSRRRIIVVSLAAIDGVGRRPDHHALRREDLARRGLEFGVVPRRLGVGIGLHPGLGERDDLIGRRDLVHEAHLLRGGGADLFALQQHLQRVRRRHEPRNTLRAAGAGEESDLYLRKSDARLVRVGDDAMVAGERELEAAAHAYAVDRRSNRLAAGFQSPVDQRQLPRPVDEEAHRRLFALRLGEAGVFLARRLKHAEVGAAGEPVLAGGEDGALD